MTDAADLIVSARELDRAFALLGRANECWLPTEAELATKRGLLVEARRAVQAARDALPH